VNVDVVKDQVLKLDITVHVTIYLRLACELELSVMLITVQHYLAANILIE
jgi:hypothetical protein